MHMLEALEKIEADRKAMEPEYIDRLRFALPHGWRIVPAEPTEVMWGGLARDIVMWTRFTGIPTGEGLHEHLRSIRPDPIPEWLTKEIPDTNQTPPKGTVAACIYKAMLEAALQ